MAKYESRIRETADGQFYALCVRIDHDGEEHVLRGYAGRYFTTRERAEASIQKHIKRTSQTRVITGAEEMNNFAHDTPSTRQEVSND